MVHAEILINEESFNSKYVQLRDPGEPARGPLSRLHALQQRRALGLALPAPAPESSGTPGCSRRPAYGTQTTSSEYKTGEPMAHGLAFSSLAALAPRMLVLRISRHSLSLVPGTAPKSPVFYYLGPGSRSYGPASSRMSLADRRVFEGSPAGQPVSGWISALGFAVPP